MAMNRLADRRIDAANPRTATRPLVSGRIAPHTAWVGAAVALAVLVTAAWQLGPLPLRLLPGALIFLIGYPYTKRFTWLSHFVLGFTDGLAPVGAWVSVRGSLFTVDDLPAWLLLGAVTLWIGGFDLIYACQDADFDRTHNLQAVPARFGIAAALRASSISHLGAIALLIALGPASNLAWPYTAGLVVVAGLLVAEHRLVRPQDLSHLSVAFFQINSAISVTLLASVMAALVLPST
jgi:4-hydroxybenzoate polyprenyltransferase